MKSKVSIFSIDFLVMAASHKIFSHSSSSIIFPGFYLLSRILNTNTFNIIYTLVILIVAVLFVLKIKVIKPKGKALIFLGLLGIIGTIILVIWQKYTIEKQNKLKK